MSDDNKQPLPVAGYTPQSPAKIELVNKFKVMEERLLREIDAMLSENMATPPGGSRPYHGRWLAAAVANLEIGFMLLNRSVFQPQRLKLPEDGQ